MSCTEGVVLALTAVGEARKSAGRSEPVKAIASSRDKLMNVSLMSDVKYYVILGRVKNSVKCHAELYHAEI